MPLHVGHVSAGLALGSLQPISARLSRRGRSGPPASPRGRPAWPPRRPREAESAARTRGRIVLHAIQLGQSEKTLG